MGAAKRVVANVDEIDRAVELLIAALPPLDPLPLDRLSRWARSSLRRHIIHELDCARPARGAPADAPAWLRERFESGEPVHHVELCEEILRLLLAALRLLIPVATRREIDRFDPAALLNRALCERQWIGRSAPSPAPEGRLRETLRLEDGRRWVELLDERALAREGALMRHCAGLCEPERASGESRLFSLRDESGRPRLTVEIHQGRLRQLRGKAQSLAKPSDWEAVGAFLALSLDGCSESASECADLTDAGCVWDPASERALAIERLPSEWLFAHDLRLWRGGARRLPEGSRVAGCLRVEADWPGVLPQALVASRAWIAGERPISDQWRFGELALASPSAPSLPSEIALLFDLSESPGARVRPRSAAREDWSALRALLLPSLG